MPDISMCNTKLCPKRESCYRFTAIANERRQSYFSQAPFYIVSGKAKCDYFWDNEKDNCKGVKREGESCNFNEKCTYPNCNLK